MTFLEPTSVSHPVDVVEQLAAGHQWPFARDKDEITLTVLGAYTEYQISFSWMPEIEALHFACAFDFKIPERRRAEVQNLVTRINEEIWVGHFDVWHDDGMVLLRHALILAGNVPLYDTQCQAVLDAATKTCERFYPALNFVVWAGKSAAEAMEAAMLETLGEA
jgi:hypothetical protein